jgi:predicted CopG family antitoxin
MSYFTPKIGPQLRGRPRSTAIPKPPEEKSTVSMRVSPELYEMIQSERRFNESYSDTIVRLLKQKSEKYVAAQKKADALEKRLLLLHDHTLKTEYVYAEHPNKIHEKH